MKRFVMGDAALMIRIAGWLLFACTGLSAAEFRAEEQSVVESDEVIEDDLYIFGDEVTIDGQVSRRSFTPIQKIAFAPD